MRFSRIALGALALIPTSLAAPRRAEWSSVEADFAASGIVLGGEVWLPPLVEFEHLANTKRPFFVPVEVLRPATPIDRRHQRRQEVVSRPSSTVPAGPAPSGASNASSSAAASAVGGKAAEVSVLPSSAALTTVAIGSSSSASSTSTSSSSSSSSSAAVASASVSNGSIGFGNTISGKINVEVTMTQTQVTNGAQTLTETCLVPVKSPQLRFCSLSVAQGIKVAGAANAENGVNTAQRAAAPSSSSSSSATATGTGFAALGPPTSSSSASTGSATPSSSSSSASSSSSSSSATSSSSSESSSGSSSAPVSVQLAAPTPTATITIPQPSLAPVSSDSTAVSNSVVSIAAASDASATSASATAAAAAEAPATVPGQKLQVLPIGLGIFGGVVLIALAVVGVVTYERRKYRRQFRERKMAESGAPMGMANKYV